MQRNTIDRNKRDYQNQQSRLHTQSGQPAHYRHNPSAANTYSGPAYSPLKASTTTLKTPTTPISPSKVRKEEIVSEGWLVFILLAIALYCVVWVIMAAQWVPTYSPLLIWSPAAGLIIGLCISKIPRFPQSILHLAACLIGHWFAIWITSVIAFHLPWTTVLSYLRAAFTGELASMGPDASRIVFFFYLVFLCFFLGYFGCWLIYRAHLPWLVALVYTSILLVNLNYVPYDMSYDVVILIGALLFLIARLSLVNQVAHWRQEGLHTDRRWNRAIIGRSMQVASIIVILTLIVGLILPVMQQPETGKIFWNNLDTAWSHLTSGQFSWQDIRALTALNNNNSNFFGDQLALTNSVHLPTGETLSYSDTTPGQDEANRPHYLQAFTYNQFDGRIWRTNVTKTFPYDADNDLPVYPTSNHSKDHLAVTITNPPHGDHNYLFVPEQPLQINVATVLYSNDNLHIDAWTQKDPLKEQETYNVTYVSPFSDQESWQQILLPEKDKQSWESDSYYPQLKANYLQVPGNVSAPTKKKVKEWTSGIDSAYAAMQAIEQRFQDPKVFSYTLDNPPIPNNMDVVQWILKNHQGYCTYYATAMAVMGRLLGIPTRIVNGFSQGHYDDERHVWVVNGSDAHSWVQAYLPSYGWISFDPTPSYFAGANPKAGPQSTPSATAAASPTATPSVVPTSTAVTNLTPTPTTRATGSHTDTNGGSGTGPMWSIIAFFTGIGILFLLAILVVLWFVWWRRRDVGDSLATSLFWRFCGLMAFLGFGPQRWQTPYEYSTMLSQRFPQQEPALKRMADLFVRDRWGSPSYIPQEQELSDHAHLQRSVRKIAWQQFWRRRK